MYRKILIACDGSEISKRAAEHGLEIAKAVGAETFGVFVVDTRTLPGAHPMVPESMAPYYFSLIEELRKLGEKAMAELSDVASKKGLTLRHQVIEGTPASGILELARRESCDLIVMGTHGRSGFAAMLLGSTAQAVVHRAEVPVLVVR